MSDEKICAQCGQPITLLRAGRGVNSHFKWYVVKGTKSEWKCGNDPNFPVRGHEPPKGTRAPDHFERRGYPFRCVCGYQAQDQHDLDEHIIVAVRIGA